MSQATAALHETAPTEQMAEEFHAAVLAGFADDDPLSASTATPEQETEASANPDAEASDATDEAPADAQDQTQDDAIDKLTVAYQRLDELEAKHKKYSDDVYGRVGMLEQVLKAQARTPAGQKVQIKLEDFGEFGTEYPDFANAQLKVINKALSELEVTGLSQEFTADLIKNAQTVAERAAEEKATRRQVESCRDELNETHPDWLDVIGLPNEDVDKGGVPPDTEFRRWLTTQPNGYAERVLNSYSSVVIGRALDKFADHKKAQQKPKATPPAVSSRQQRLTAAVPARTAGSVPSPKRELTGMAAVLEGFNS